MDLNTFISYATFDVVGEVVFSKQFGFLEEGKDIDNAIQNSLALNSYIVVAGYFHWVNIVLLANPVMTWLSILPMGHLFDTVKTVLVDREKNANTRYDAVQYWLKQHERHPDKLTIREINTQALAAVGAGSDTVAAGIQSFVYHMIRTPGAWARAQSEVTQAFRNGKCKDSVISYADAQGLRYSDTFGPTTIGVRTNATSALFKHVSKRLCAYSDQCPWDFRASFLMEVWRLAIVHCPRVLSYL
jgi:hypothetical protein